MALVQLRNSYDLWLFKQFLKFLRRIIDANSHKSSAEIRQSYRFQSNARYLQSSGKEILPTKHAKYAKRRIDFYFLCFIFRVFRVFRGQ